MIVCKMRDVILRNMGMVLRGVDVVSASTLEVRI